MRLIQSATLSSSSRPPWLAHRLTKLARRVSFVSCSPSEVTRSSHQAAEVSLPASMLALAATSAVVLDMAVPAARPWLNQYAAAARSPFSAHFRMMRSYLLLFLRGVSAVAAILPSKAVEFMASPFLLAARTAETATSICFSVGGIPATTIFSNQVMAPAVSPASAKHFKINLYEKALGRRPFSSMSRSQAVAEPGLLFVSLCAVKARRTSLYTLMSGSMPSAFICSSDRTAPSLSPCMPQRCTACAKVCETLARAAAAPAPVAVAEGCRPF
mmetsp:Transcript_71549/g.202990  ORF Transcript_71549/g.202990 Transcript_71549/m.202990 type:complete len:272 (+) Transcript_71549:108-923(+)